MRIFYDILPEKQNTAAALGFFDGLHAGHRKVINFAAAEKHNGLIPVCFTFAQSPKSVLTGRPYPALMTKEDKTAQLDKFGIEHIYCVDFTKLMNISAEDFVKNILIDKLKAKKLFCGFNYRFGKNGEGNAQTLKTLCGNCNVDVVVVPAQQAGGTVVSSTVIRRLISVGDVRRANEMMCVNFGFSAIIEHGEHFGRTMGTPTINQPLCSELVVPKFGVYASAITLENGEKYCGVTNIGVKPTVGKFSPRCETWMPEYKGKEIYGQTADVRLLDFIRPERKFSNIDELKNTIKDNGITAKKIFEEEYKNKNQL